MKYNDVKRLVAEMVDEHQAKGCSLEEAERRVLSAGIALFQAKKIGFMDLKYIYQFLGYDFHGDLEKTMEDIKKAIRMDYGLNEIILGLTKCGRSEEEAIKETIFVCYREFKEGHIETPELLDMTLWALGYRLKDEFFQKPELMKTRIFYEEDE